MPKNTPLQGKQKWEESIDKLFDFFEDDPFGVDWKRQKERTKDFIHSLLASQKEELREKIEGMKKVLGRSMNLKVNGKRKWDFVLRIRTLEDVLSLLEENHGTENAGEEKKCLCVCHCKAGECDLMHDDSIDECPHCQKGKK